MFTSYSFPICRCLALLLLLDSAVKAQTTMPASSPPAAVVSGSGAPVAPPKFSDNKIVLTPEQSTGGIMFKAPNGVFLGVSLDASCAANFKTLADACIEWKLTEPLPAGWWHGHVQSDQRNGYANREIGIMLVSSQKPSVIVAPNYPVRDKDAPQEFEFWIYSTGAVESVRIQPNGDLWRWKNTWPVTRITLEHKVPTGLTAEDAVTVDLPVQPDGVIPLPMRLPTGNWSMTGVTKMEGIATIEGENKKAFQTILPTDRWKKVVPRTACFYMDSPLCKVTSNTPNLFANVLLRHNITRQATPVVSEGTLITTVDPSKTETGELVMIGSNLVGDAPTFPLLPQGQKTAVITTWDDGKPEDLRCAEILNKYGYHPSFFMNQNSPAMQFLDKLEALNVEVGSHTSSHPSLHAIPPQRALEECVEMRKMLEKALHHPVISFGYPNGYSPANDVDGDYVLRAVKAAGYWSGRTTRTKSETVDSYGDLLTMDSDGFFGNAKDLERVWPLTQAKEGGVFYFWGHSWQIGKTDEQWKKFEDFVAQFAKQPNTWYPSQGDFSLWLWARKNVQFAVASKTSTKVVVKLNRPWLHPYLAAKCPLSLKVPTGVTKVTWQGKELPVSNGFVELTWTQS